MNNKLDSDLLKDKIKALLRGIITEQFLALVIENITIEYPRDRSLGDYACPIALQISKQLKINGLETASVIVDLFNKKKPDFIKEVKAVPPGFINFTVDTSYLLNTILTEILREKEQYGNALFGMGKTVIVEYSDPNIAKPLGIHHLLATIIGQSLCNLYKSIGFNVIAWNYIGDWGTQFGKLCYAYKKWGDKKAIQENPIEELFQLYVKFHAEAEKNPQLEDFGRAEFKKIEDGGRENTDLWLWLVDVSLKDIQKTYNMLGNIHFDLIRGESYYRDKMEPILDEGKKKGVFKKGKGGAYIVEFENEKYPTCVVQKSDDATLYHTRDLAMIDDRLMNFLPYKVLHVVDIAQKLYFEQLFEIAHLLGRNINGFEHVAFGRMNFPEGRMSTRKGTVVLLNDVLKEAIDRAYKIVESKNPSLLVEEKNNIAQIVGIGAVKYSVLSQNRLTNITFTWDKILALDGNSAPYLQYTYARAKNILREERKMHLSSQENKINEDFSFIQKLNDLADNEIKTIQKQKDFSVDRCSSFEINVLRHLAKYTEYIAESAHENKPNILANYLFELASLFNEFYKNVSVINSEDEITKKQLLALVKAVTIVLKNGLAILGIDVVERM